MYTEEPEMNELETKGKIQTLRVFASVLLSSLFILVTYQIALGEIDEKKLIQQLIRFGLTVLLMVFIFKGKEWAKNIFTFLFVLGILNGLWFLFKIYTLEGKIPIIFLIIIYSIAIHHLNFSESFKAYFKHLKKNQ